MKISKFRPDGHPVNKAEKSERSILCNNKLLDREFDWITFLLHACCAIWLRTKAII